MPTIRKVISRAEVRGLMTVFAVLVFVVCLSSTASALVLHQGCGMPGSPARICASTVAVDPGLAMLPQMPLVPPRLTPTAWLPSPSVVPVIVQFHADPSTPRAPPLSLL